MKRQANALPATVGSLMPQLKADLARLVAIPSISALGLPGGDARPRCSRRYDAVVELLRDAGVDRSWRRSSCPDTAPVVTRRDPGARRRADGPALQPLRRRRRPATSRSGSRRRSRRPSATARSTAAAAADTKSNILMHVGALRAWDGKPPVGIKIVIEGQEEVGAARSPPTRRRSPELFARRRDGDRRHGQRPARACRR